MQIDAVEQAVIDEALRLVGRVPISMAGLVEQLVAAGVLDFLDTDDADERLEAVGELIDLTDRLWTTADDQLVMRLDLRIDATVFTHRLTADEIAAGAVVSTPDLVAIDHDLDVDQRLTLVDGPGTLDLVFADGSEATGVLENGAYVGPTGWLATFTAGDLLAFRRRGTSIEITALRDPHADGSSEVSQLRERYAAITSGQTEALEPELIILDALAHDSELWATPTAPIGELLADAGLRFERGFIGPAHEAWEPPDTAGQLLRSMIANDFGFSPCCDQAFDIAIDAFDTYDDANLAVDINWTLVGEALVHSDVTRALVTLASHAEGQTSVRIADFATHLADREGHGRAAGAFMSALVLDDVGEVETAAIVLEQAIVADPNFDAAIDEYARMLADRGELEPAIRLRQKLSFEQDPELAYLLSLRSTRRTAVGRNDSCPCGSGKKFKVCCIDKPATMNPTLTASWLQHKLVGYAYGRANRASVVELCQQAAGAQVDHTAASEIARGVFENGLAACWLLFNGGVAQRFLETRGVLLPANEREMLTDWVRRPLALFDIIACAHGTTLTVRDTGTGTEHIVHDVTASKQHSAGESVLAHIGLVGSHIEFVGIPIGVEPHHRADTVDLVSSEPDASDMADWFAVIAAPTGEH